jgi:hypothetical protein
MKLTDTHDRVCVAGWLIAATLLSATACILATLTTVYP